MERKPVLGRCLRAAGKTGGGRARPGYMNESRLGLRASWSSHQGQAGSLLDDTKKSIPSGLADGLHNEARHDRPGRRSGLLARRQGDPARLLRPNWLAIANPLENASGWRGPQSGGAAAKLGSGAKGVQPRAAVQYWEDFDVTIRFLPRFFDLVGEMASHCVLFFSFSLNLPLENQHCRPGSSSR